MNREKLGNDLKMFIHKHAITQEEMGRLTDTSSSTISRCMRGDNGITNRTLEKIKEALKVLNEQTEIESEEPTEVQTLKNNKFKNIEHLSFEANGTKFKHDKKNKCLYVKNKDIDLKITLT